MIDKNILLKYMVTIKNIDNKNTYKVIILILFIFILCIFIYSAFI
jgi:hypothetical protein